MTQIDLSVAIRTAMLIVAVICFPACSSPYYVKVVDQNGQPVEGARISYKTLNGNPYFTNAKGHKAMTSRNGTARLVAGRSNEFREIEKDGYQIEVRRQIYRRFNEFWVSGRWLKQHGRRNPFIIHAWRRGAEPSLEIVKGQLRVVNDSRECTIKLVTRNNQTLRLAVHNDMIWRETSEETRRIDPNKGYSLEGWQSRIRVLGAKVKQTDDLFMNEADLEGYEDEIVIDREDRKDHIYFFIRSEDPVIFGGGILHLDPVSVATKSEADAPTRGKIDFQLWFNLDGSTNIMRDENAGWQNLDLSRGGPRFSCEKDEESSRRSDR